MSGIRVTSFTIDEDFPLCKKNVYWKDGDSWMGYLEEYPDYMTQGTTLEELKENLKDIYKELLSGTIPCVRKVEELEVT